MTEPVRLSKRLSDMVGCSRREAELYIEGGWVRVDGQVVETPQFKVQDQNVELDAKARLEPVSAATLVLHKPADYDWDEGRRPASRLLVEAAHGPDDHHAPRLLRRHLTNQVCVTPLESGATGMLVFTQDWRVQRKLVQDLSLIHI